MPKTSSSLSTTLKPRSIGLVLPVLFYAACHTNEPQDVTISKVTIPTEAVVNFESPHVHPIDRTENGQVVLAVNTAAARVEIFSPRNGGLRPVASVPVGLDPVTVRVRDDNEAWIVNHISDSITVVELTGFTVTRTFTTADEPTDVVFAGNPIRAYVSCSQANVIQVYDPDNPGNPTGVPEREIVIDGEDPRQLAVSTNGETVYAAIFESGNPTTILGGGTTLSWPPDALAHPAGPYGGQSNPPPNQGAGFEPAINEALPPPPEVSLIVRKQGSIWLDDNGGDWTRLVSGDLAGVSGRLPGWDVVDHDVAIIPTDSAQPVQYADQMMTAAMALSVHPTSEDVMLVGTEATNEVRFEPNLRGNFIHVRMGRFNPAAPGSTTVTDLNPHLDYTAAQVDSADDALRNRSIGDPRGIVWRSTGDRGYVVGLGSNNVIVIDSNGARLNPISAPTTETIEVAEGPTGLAIDEANNRLYVLNRFAGSISVIDLDRETVLGAIAFYDPTPNVIRNGRRHLYSTHDNSALGQIACASCHLDGRMDRLAWDLGDPSGDMEIIVPLAQGGDYNLRLGTETSGQDFHPMKGPMVTQTLQGIIGNEPLHWRGDQPRFHDFAAAFDGLQGSTVRSLDDMQEFADFVATMHFPPNPNRSIDNTLPTDVPLPGLVSTGRYAPRGTPLPNGNAERGLTLYRELTTLPGDGLQTRCVSCHTLPTGSSTDLLFNFNAGSPIFEPAPLGPLGEARLWVSGPTQPNVQTLKVPQLRNIAERTSLDYNTTVNLGGFGLVHDGTLGSLPQLLSVNSISLDTIPGFPDAVQNMADLCAFVFSMTGPGLPEGTLDPNDQTPLGVLTVDVHAGVGSQVSIDAAGLGNPAVLAQWNTLIAIASDPDVELIVKVGPRGGLYDSNVGTFTSDLTGQTLTVANLQSFVQSGSVATFTLVPNGTGRRLGIDRDNDGCLDTDERVSGTNPANPSDCTP